MTHNNNLPIYHIAFSENNQKHFIGFYEMLEMVKKGILNKETYVWKKGFKQWVKAYKIDELKPLFETPPDIPEELQECYQLFD